MFEQWGKAFLLLFGFCVFGGGHRFSSSIFSNRSSNMCNVTDDFTNGDYMVLFDNLYSFHFVCKLVQFQAAQYNQSGKMKQPLRWVHGRLLWFYRS